MQRLLPLAVIAILAGTPSGGVGIACESLPGCSAPGHPELNGTDVLTIARNMNSVNRIIPEGSR